jgi:UDP-N-acetylmuramate dehydrogenase
VIIKKNVVLKPFNTFGIKSIAKRFFVIENNDDLINLFNNYRLEKFFVLGGGSNILLINQFYSDVIFLANQELKIISSDKDFTIVEVSAGYNWHKFLEFCLKNNLYGMENLALIPGNCGAAPIQNIGAYGVEQSEYFYSATVFDINTKSFKLFYNKDCNFSYRESIFKKNRNFIITNIRYKLKNYFEPNLEYNELKKIDSKNITANELFDKIIEIRRKKIPYPEQIGNAGSFFKNPIVNYDKLEELKNKYENLPFYSFNSEFKISAAWLIEKAGLKGFALNDAAVSDRHSLVIVNKGNATGEEIYKLSEMIIDTVYNLFGIKLECEVNVIN